MLTKRQKRNKLKALAQANMLDRRDLAYYRRVVRKGDEDKNWIAHCEHQIAIRTNNGS